MLKVFLLGLFASEVWDFMVSSLLSFKWKLLMLICSCFSQRFQFLIGILLCFKFSVELFHLSRNYLFYNAISTENLS